MQNENARSKQNVESKDQVCFGDEMYYPVLFNPDMTVMPGITSAMQKQTGKIQKGIQLYKEIMHIIYTVRQYLYEHVIQRGVLKSLLPKTFS